MSSADSLAGGASSECPKCGSDNIELDSVQVLRPAAAECLRPPPHSNPTSPHAPLLRAQATCACASPLWPTCSVTHPAAQALTFCLDCGFVLANEQLDISVAFGEDGERSGVRVSGNDDGTGAGGAAHAA